MQLLVRRRNAYNFEQLPSHDAAYDIDFLPCEELFTKVGYSFHLFFEDGKVMEVFDLVELFECVVVIFGIIDVGSYGEVFLVFLGDVVFELLLDLDVY